MTAPEKPWGTTRESVAEWCRLPISWRGQRGGYRTPPKLSEGDPARILFAAWPDGLSVEILDELGGAATDLDQALENLAEVRDAGNRTEVADARDNAETCLDAFYDALRQVLHPELVGES